MVRAAGAGGGVRGGAAVWGSGVADGVTAFGMLASFRASTGEIGLVCEAANAGTRGVGSTFGARGAGSSAFATCGAGPGSGAGAGITGGGSTAAGFPSATAAALTGSGAAAGFGSRSAIWLSSRCSLSTCFRRNSSSRRCSVFDASRRSRSLPVLTSATIAMTGILSTNPAIRTTRSSMGLASKCKRNRVLVMERSRSALLREFFIRAVTLDAKDQDGLSDGCEYTPEWVRFLLPGAKARLPQPPATWRRF
jgi:hypothetical protein